MDVDPLTSGREVSRERRIGWAIVTAIWIAAGVVVYLLATVNVTPRRYIDEFLYWNLAKSFSHGAGLSWNDATVALRSWLYPVAISPVFKLASSVQAQYQAVQAVNAFMLCSVVFPAYWIARRFVGRGLGLLAALLAISVPAMNYAGIVGTENLAYLTCTLAFAGMLLALAGPSLRSAAFALLLIAAAALTRTQFLILIPILIAAMLLVAAMQGAGARREYLRAQRALLVALGFCFVIGGAYALLAGRASLGLYAGLLEGANLTAGDFIFWLRGFSADVYLLAGILPTVATFALIGGAGNRRDPWVGSLVALALSASVFFVLQMSWFSAINTFHWRELHVFYERYMFYLGPLFFTGLVAAVGRITTRAAAVSTIVGAVIVALTPPDIVAVPFSIDAFGQAYLGFLFDQNDSLLPKVGWILAALTLLLGGLLVLSTLSAQRAELKKWGRALALGAPLFLLLMTQAKAWTYSSIYSESVMAQQPKPLDFVDLASGGRAGILVAKGSDPSTFYATSFWSPGIDRYFVSDKSPIDSPVVYAPKCQFRWAADGRIFSPSSATGNCPDLPRAWLVQSNTFSMHLRDETARVKAKGGVASTVSVAGLPARIFSLAGGRNVRDGSVAGVYTLRSFLNVPGELELVVKTRSDGVTLQLPGGRTTKLVARTARTITIPVPARDHVTRVNVLSRAGAAVKNVTFERVRMREGEGPWRNVS